MGIFSPSQTHLLVALHNLCSSGLEHISTVAILEPGGGDVPTVARIGEFRFFFYSLENRELAHVHVERGRSTAKFWLAPVRLASSKGFRPHEVNRIARIVERNLEIFREAWNEHFDEGELIRRQRESDR